MLVTFDTSHEDRLELKVEHPKNAEARDVLEDMMGIELIPTIKVLN